MDKPKTIKKPTIKKATIEKTKKQKNRIKSWMDWYNELPPEKKEERLKRRRKGYISTQVPVPVPVPFFEKNTTLKLKNPEFEEFLVEHPIKTISKYEMQKLIFPQDYSGMNDLGSIGEAGPSTSKGGSKRIKKRRFSKGRFSKRRSK
jgi:hypothetical protein